jgi:hypothetical protein
MRQEGILLSFVKTMDFIDEQYRPLFEIPVGLGALDDCQYVFFASRNGTEFNEIRVQLASDDAGKGGFSATGRTP